MIEADPGMIRTIEGRKVECSSKKEKRLVSNLFQDFVLPFTLSVKIVEKDLNMNAKSKRQRKYWQLVCFRKCSQS